MAYAHVLAFVVLFTAALADADEIHLTDGRKLEWTLIKDLGDSYEVVTVQGPRVTIKKADVEKFVKITPQALTGAAVTLEKKRKVGTVDLLKTVDPGKSSAGTWQVLNGRLVSPQFPHGRLTVPVSLGNDYDVTVVVERVKGDGAFYLCLPVNERRFMVALDATAGIEGGIVDVPSTTFQQKMFRDTTPHTLVYSVRPGLFTLTFDGKTLITWEPADYKTISLVERVDTPHKGIIIGVYDTTYAISRMTLTLPVGTK
jgi:predicted RNA-binding protein with TRAM domain